MPGGPCRGLPVDAVVGDLEHERRRPRWRTRTHDLAGGGVLADVAHRLGEHGLRERLELRGDLRHARPRRAGRGRRARASRRSSSAASVVPGLARAAGRAAAAARCAGRRAPSGSPRRSAPAPRRRAAASSASETPNRRWMTRSWMSRARSMRSSSWRARSPLEGRDARASRRARASCRASTAGRGASSLSGVGVRVGLGEDDARPAAGGGDRDVDQRPVADQLGELGRDVVLLRAGRPR